MEQNKNSFLQNKSEEFHKKIRTVFFQYKKSILTLNFCKNFILLRRTEKEPFDNGLFRVFTPASD